MCPSSPEATMRGRKEATPCTTPCKFTPNTHIHSATESVACLPPPPTPALLHSTCTAPNRAKAAVASASTASAEDTSTSCVITSPPKARTDSAAVARVFVSRSAITTSSPAFANRFDMAKPIPLAAPVTTATLPFPSFMPSRLTPSARLRTMLAKRPE